MTSHALFRRKPAPQFLSAAKINGPLGHKTTDLHREAEELAKKTATHCRECRLEGYWTDGICPECAAPKPKPRR